jgi:hypothetical protein
MRRTTPHAEGFKESLEIRTSDGGQCAGGADPECELVGEIGIEARRQQIVTGGNPYPVAGDMQEREVLGMAVDVPRHQVEQRRADEAVALSMTPAHGCKSDV